MYEDGSEAAESGVVLVLRTCNADITSHGGFRWPESGPVEAPDWRDDLECGGGLHGWLWGEGDYSLGKWQPDARWLVVAVAGADIRDLNGKVKFPRGDVLLTSDRAGATAFLASQPGAAGKAIIGFELATTGYAANASTTGDAGQRLDDRIRGQRLDDRIRGQRLDVGGRRDLLGLRR